MTGLELVGDDDGVAEHRFELTPGCGRGGIEPVRLRNVAVPGCR
jgi:hypothetical protein